MDRKTLDEFGITPSAKTVEFSNELLNLCELIDDPTDDFHQVKIIGSLVFTGYFKNNKKLYIKRSDALFFPPDIATKFKISLTDVLDFMLLEKLKIMVKIRDHGTKLLDGPITKLFTPQSARMFLDDIVSVSKITTRKLTFDILVYLNSVISMFSVYDYYVPIMNKYMKEPDSGVYFVIYGKEKETETIPREVRLKFIEDNLYNQSTVEKVAEIKTQDIKATCHLFLQFMVKSFTAEKKKQPFEALNQEILNIIENDLGNVNEKIVVHHDFLIALSLEMVKFPKLICTLSKVTKSIVSPYPELQLAFNLTKFAGMAAIKTVLEFLRGSTKTLAHRNVNLFQEMKSFQENVISIQSRITVEMFPFMRFIEPENNEITAKKFPNLFSVGKVYATKFIDKKYSNLILKVNPTIPGILKQSCTKDENWHRFSTHLGEKLMEWASITLGLDTGKLSFVSSKDNEVSAEDITQAKLVVNATLLKLNQP